MYVRLVNETQCFWERGGKHTSWLHRHQEKQWCSSSIHWCFLLSIWGLPAQRTSYQLVCQRTPNNTHTQNKFTQNQTTKKCQCPSLNYKMQKKFKTHPVLLRPDCRVMSDLCSWEIRVCFELVWRKALHCLYLNLRCMKVHSDDVVCSGYRQHVGDQLGWDWSPTLQTKFSLINIHS